MRLNVEKQVRVNLVRKVELVNTGVVFVEYLLTKRLKEIVTYSKFQKLHQQKLKKKFEG